MSEAIMQKIKSLDDDTAIRILSQMTSVLGHRAGGVEPGDRQLVAALAENTAASTDMKTPPPTDGDAARAALQLLVTDEQHAAPIRQMIDHPAPQNFGIVTTTLLAAGIIFALQSHIKIEKNADGTWTIKFEKKPTKDTLITPLVKKLLAIVGP